MSRGFFSRLGGAGRFLFRFAWRNVPLIVSVLYLNGTLALAESVQVSFRYPFHPEENPTYGYRVLPYPDRVTQVGPYSTIEFKFSRSLSESEKTQFAAGLRVYQTAPFESPLSHLHEISELREIGMPETGPTSSFYWFENTDIAQTTTLLHYTPFGLVGGGQFRIQLPEGWAFAADLGEKFETESFDTQDSSQVRVHQVFIADYDAWKVLSTIKGGFSWRNYTPAVFYDERDHRFYPLGEIKNRGNGSSSWKKRSYTFQFDKKYRFRGFEAPNAPKTEKDRRKSVVMIGGRTHRSIINNRTAFEIARKVEKKVYFRKFNQNSMQPVTLTPRSIFTELVMNGRYWGIYQMIEHAKTGDDSMMTAPERRLAGIVDRPIVHNFDVDGERFHGTGLGEEPAGLGIAAESDLEHVIAVGDGKTRDYQNLAFPLNIYIHKLVRDGSDIEIQVKAKNRAGESMKLSPKIDINAYDIRTIPLVDEVTGAPAGEVRLKATGAEIDASFSEAVAAGESIRLEYRSLDDLRLFEREVLSPEGDISKIRKWMDVDSTLLWIFVSRLIRATDNITGNRYLFANAGDLEHFLPEGAEGPIAKYFHFFWDCDWAFGIPNGDYPNDAVWEREVINDPKMQQRYANWFFSETLVPEDPNEQSGVATVRFYDQLAEQYKKEYGDRGPLWNDRRWELTEPNAMQDLIDDYIIPTVGYSDDPRHAELANTGPLNYGLKYRILSLKPNQYIHPQNPFLRGDVNGDGRIQVTDARLILDKLFVDKNDFCQRDVCDVNDDGDVDLSDAIYLLLYIVGKVPAPPQPFPNPGYDLTEDSLPE